MNCCIASAPVKICSQCKLPYPATSEYFGKQHTVKSGLRAGCRNCTRTQNRGYQKVYSPLHKERTVAYRKAYNSTIRGHLLRIYGNMVRRCTNPKTRGYNRYGGRGIKVCFEREEFIEYVIGGLQVDPCGLDCDRIDNDGNYEPGNIQFVTHKENCQNRG